jgi:hypothetical protein
MPIVCYRDQIIRAVTGGKPAMAERAVEILRAKGHGQPGLLLDELAELVPAIK